jgi:hypothetical protein
MSLWANVNKTSNRQRLTNVAGGEEFERPQLFARPANPTALRSWRTAATDAAASARNKTKLFAGQLNGRLCSTFLGALLCLYKLHVSHPKKITDQFVRKYSMPTLWGGVKLLLPFGSQGKLLLNPILQCPTVKEAS